MTQVLTHTLATHIRSMSKSSLILQDILLSTIPHGTVALNPAKIQTFSFPLGENLQRNISGQVKMTLPLSQALGNPAPPVTLSCSHGLAHPVANVARSNAKGQEQNCPFQQPPTINHVKLYPWHDHFAKQFLVWNQQLWYEQVSQSAKEVGCLGGKTGAKHSVGVKEHRKQIRYSY